VSEQSEPKKPLPIPGGDDPRLLLRLEEMEKQAAESKEGGTVEDADGP
jgi:hypothetical protein